MPAMLLHKATEYEPTHNGGDPYKGNPSISLGIFIQRLMLSS